MGLSGGNSQSRRNRCHLSEANNCDNVIGGASWAAASKVGRIAAVFLGGVRDTVVAACALEGRDRVDFDCDCPCGSSSESDDPCDAILAFFCLGLAGVAEGEGRLLR